MKSSIYPAILIVVLGILCQGCSDKRSDSVPVDSQPAQKLVADLQTTLEKSRENLDREKERNVELMQRVQSLLEKLQDTESRGARSRSADGSNGSNGAEKKRIELMGAKALAEFRAEQFRKRLDELGSDLDLKERELESIHQNSAQKDVEVQQLRKTIEELHAADKTRTAELNARMEQITRDLQERTAAANAFKKDLDDKTELLSALKIAVADAARLKSNAESEIERLRAELTETVKNLEITQGLLSQERQDMVLARQSIEQTQAEMEKLRKDLAQSQGETERSVQETEQMRTIAEAWKNQADQFQADLELSRQEAEQFRAEADRSRQEIVLFRVETDRAKQEARELHSQVAELTGKLQALEPEPASPSDQGTSSVDALLEVPTASGERAPASNLY